MAPTISALIVWPKQVTWSHLTSKEYDLAMWPSVPRKKPKSVGSSAGVHPSSVSSLLNPTIIYKILLVQKLIFYLQPMLPVSSPWCLLHPVFIHVKIPIVFWTQHSILCHHDVLPVVLIFLMSGISFSSSSFICLRIILYLHF